MNWKEINVCILCDIYTDLAVGIYVRLSRTDVQLNEI